MRVYSKSPYWRAVKIFGMVALALLLVCQFIGPRVVNYPATGDISLPPDVKKIFVRSCYDCHSNETKLRWADRIAPISWRVASHVKAGRNHLNFSEWNKLSAADQKLRIWESINHAILGEMPKADYTLVHPNARLTTGDIAILKRYLVESIENRASDTAKVNAEVTQYQQWLLNVRLSSLPVSPNGIPYDSDYKNWQPISTSDRFESGTMRVIFGNDIAIKAINNDETRSWPDGTRLAKALWADIVDSAGNVRTGAFVQLDLMIKNKRQYAATGGWGFARFKTINMAPYGKNPSFASECINCHRPLKDQDYVFTIPLKH